jgi:hypothetical protein
MITHEGLRYTTRISVCNYSTYQDFEDENNTRTTHELTHEQHTSNTRITPNNNVKKDKNERKKKERTQFVEPTIESLATKMPLDEAKKFYYYYGSKGWIVGRTKMQDVNKAISGWMTRADEYKANNQITPPQTKQLSDEERQARIDKLKQQSKQTEVFND